MKPFIRMIYTGSLCLFFVACTTVAQYNNDANQLTRQSDFTSAIRTYTLAQVNEPDNATLYLNSAQAYYESGQFSQAIEALQQAILRGDDAVKAQAYYNMGNFYFMAGQYDNAINAYQEALIMNADDTNARHNLELALLYRQTPTPVDDEMKTEPDQNQVDPTSLPTNQPLDFDGPTPTPPPIDFNNEEEPEGGLTGENFGNQTQGTPSPREQATLSIPQAEELLDPIQQDQNIYSVFSDEVATPTNSDALKEW